MIDTPIVLHLRQRSGGNIDAILTPAQFEAIKNEFRQTPEWAYFLEYCSFVSNQRLESPAIYVDKFEISLSTVLGHHTEYIVPMLWPVIDVLCAEVA